MLMKDYGRLSPAIELWWHTLQWYTKSYTYCVLSTVRNLNSLGVYDLMQHKQYKYSTRIIMGCDDGCWDCLSRANHPLSDWKPRESIDDDDDDEDRNRRTHCIVLSRYNRLGRKMRWGGGGDEEDLVGRNAISIGAEPTTRTRLPQHSSI